MPHSDRPSKLQKTDNDDRSASVSSPPPHPPPYKSLYRHALESIFAHLGLADLAHISATCRDWAAAVTSMRPIGARLVAGTAKLNTINKYRSIPVMMRHVAVIRVKRTHSLPTIWRAWYGQPL